jgi:hypothetical protein
MRPLCRRQIDASKHAKLALGRMQSKRTKNATSADMLTFLQK